MKKTSFLALVLCAVAAAIVTAAFVAYVNHIKHGAPPTAFELLADFFFLPGLFLSAVFMLSLPASHALMYVGAFIELFILFWLVFSIISRLWKKHAA